jgi:DNA-binding PadR family transcriptional regulator
MSNRFFRHRELHVVLLALLAERPMHGYELMGELGERFGPTYRPSAGSVYPALDSLAAEGLIEPEPTSDPTTYTLTPIGERALSNRSRELLKLGQRTGVTLGSVAPVEAAIARLIETARSAARVADGGRVELLLAETAERLDSLTTKETS